MLTQEQIKECFSKVFPNSSISIRTGILGSKDLYCRIILAKNKDELSHGITENDPLDYRFEIDETGKYTESACSISLKPEEEYLAYSHKKLRGKTIKDVNIDKLIKRFLDVKNFISNNKENFINLKFDIEEKLK